MTSGQKTPLVWMKYVLLVVLAAAALGQAPAPPVAVRAKDALGLDAAKTLSDLEVEKQTRLVTELQLIQTQIQLLNERLVVKQAELRAHEAGILNAHQEPEGSIDWQSRRVLPKPKPKEAAPAPAAPKEK